MSLALPAPRAPALSALVRSWTAHEIAHGRFSLWLPVFTAAGIALAVAAPVDPSAPLLGVALAGLFTLRAVAGRVAALAWSAGALLALAALTGGALLLALQAEWRGTPLLKEPRVVTMTGRIVASEARGEGRQRLVLAPIETNLPEAAPRRVRVSIRADEEWRVGETVRLTGRLFPLRGPVYPGGYDAARRLFFDGIGATGYAFGTPERVAPAPATSLATRIDALRDAVETRVTTALEDGNAGLASALLVGRRGGMNPDDVEALRVSGLGHILAISGLHMALVAGSVFAAVRFGLALFPAVALRYPVRKWAAVAGLAAGTVYLALSGGSVATVRAYVMLVVALLAILADRPALTMRTVAVAAVALMALDPVSVVEPGFQMSFLAVVALVGAYEWWTRKRMNLASGWIRPFVVFFAGLAATSLIAGFATGPAAVYHFHRLAPLGLLANLAAMPVLTLVAMPAGVLALALMPLGLDWVPLAVMDAGLSAILGIAHAVASWTGSAGLVGAVPVASSLLAALGILWLAILTAPWRLAGVVFIAAGLAVAPFAPRYDLLISDDASTVAARGPDGRLAILGEPDGFAAAVWLKADGDPRPAGPGVAGGRCDPLGCTLPLREGVAAVPSSPRALAEDCRRAEAVVFSGSVRACAAPLVVDRWILRYHGALAARRDGDDWHVDTARPDGHRRAWQLPPDVGR